HLGNWEMYGAIPTMDRFTLNPVYRPANNPILDWLMFRRRTGTLIPKGVSGARLILDTLKKRQFVVMLCDQKLREGITIPFFGVPAKTPAAIATIALKMRVPILMAKCVRTAGGRFEAVVFPLDNLPAGKDDAAVRAVMKRINGIYEDWIRETPEQYLWIHRRYDKSAY
ncbi:MAG: lysophospholipid acyltransferase family protein, partial [Alphaproteobacteria bacterium]|nr:lysophospholipid acyltransferase family protein [Alphaproteobacteria bacterium]